VSFDRYIASVSFGKDSLAMVLLILERGLPLDEVVFYDTGMEFKAIYDTRDRVLPILYDHGVKYTELRPPRPPGRLLRGVCGSLRPGTAEPDPRRRRPRRPVRLLSADPRT